MLARVDHPDAARADAQALDDLSNGADGLHLAFAGAGGAYGYGLAGADAASLDALFDGVSLDAGPTIELDLGPAAEDQALAVAALAERSGADPGRLDLSFGLDPLGALARSGRVRPEWPATAGRLAVSSANSAAAASPDRSSPPTRAASMRRAGPGAGARLRAVGGEPA